MPKDKPPNLSMTDNPLEPKGYNPFALLFGVRIHGLPILLTRISKSYNPEWHSYRIADSFFSSGTCNRSICFYIFLPVVTKGIVGQRQDGRFGCLSGFFTYQLRHQIAGEAFGELPNEPHPFRISNVEVGGALYRI